MKNTFPVNYYMYPHNPVEVLKEMITLVEDIERGYHIPVRFRKKPFTDEAKQKYVGYLNKEIEAFKYRLSRTH